MHSLRSAEHIVDFEKRLEQQCKCNGHYGGIVPARAQDREEQKRASQGSQQAANQQNQQVRHRRARIEDGGGIRADAKERSPRKIEYAGVAELNVQAEGPNRIEQDRIDQQQYEMIVVEIRCNHERGDDRAAAQGILMVGEAGAHAVEQAEPGGGHDNSNASHEQ